MSVYKRKHVKSAKFFRGVPSSIDIILSSDSECISLFTGIIGFCAKSLSEIELEEVIKILSSNKKAMLKQRNFPSIYEEMLSDLINVQTERYEGKTDKKVKLGYSVGLAKLEEIHGLYYKIKNVHAYSIDVGCDRTSAERIDLKSDDRYLVLSFREEEKGDE
jgi:hypothetical protein